MFESKLIDILPILGKKSRKKLRNDYKSWAKKRPCLVNNIVGVDGHHIRMKHNCGMGLKPPDEYIIPLDHELHMELHTMGVKSFEEKYSISLEKELVKLHNKFVEEMQGV